MPRKSPGARARGIGAQLRAMRQERNMSIRRAAELVGWERGRLSRIETGKQNSSVEDVAALLAILGVTDERRDQLLAQVKADDEPGWWDRNTGVTADSAALLDYEAHASEIISWAPLIIPGLLQTMDYAHEVLGLYDIEPEVIGSRLAARVARQRAVAGKPYVAFIGEAALRTVVGSRRVMAAQFTALIDREVSVRVVPSDAAAHLGQLGAFLMLRFPSAPTVVHVELLRSGVFLDSTPLTEPYEHAAAQIAMVAHGETESRRLIESARSNMEA